MVLEDERVLVAQQAMFGAKALRLSLSEVYQNLNAQSILQEMVEGNSSSHSIREMLRPTALDMHRIFQLFNVRSPSTFLFALCSILESRDSPKQRKLAMTLRSGMYVPKGPHAYLYHYTPFP